MSDVKPLPPPEDFIEQAAAIGVEFEPGDLEQLGLYLALLLEANKAFNLTAITEPADAWTRHILDSLSLLPLLADLPDGAEVADVGSGGGAPAIPLAIVMPALRFTLIESTGKKAAFLESCAKSLGLSNVAVVCDRAETLGQDRRAHREKYDAVTARALGRVAVVAELTIPLAKPGHGKVLLVKGQQAEEELVEAAGALRRLHAGLAGIVPTPTGRIVVLEKRGAVPRDFPRRPGEPKRMPLR